MANIWKTANSGTQFLSHKKQEVKTGHTKSSIKADDIKIDDTKVEDTTLTCNSNVAETMPTSYRGPEVHSHVPTKQPCNVQPVANMLTNSSDLQQSQGTLNGIPVSSDPSTPSMVQSDPSQHPSGNPGNTAKRPDPSSLPANPKARISWTAEEHRYHNVARAVDYLIAQRGSKPASLLNAPMQAAPAISSTDLSLKGGGGAVITPTQNNVVQVTSNKQP